MSVTEGSSPLARLLAYGREASIDELCLPHSLERATLQEIDARGVDRRELGKGRILFRQGQTLHALYVISRGLVETTMLDADGHRQVTGFHFPGDFVGLDALHERAHVCTAAALVASHVRVLPLHRLDTLVARMPRLRDQIESLVSKNLAEHEQLLMVVNQRSATARVAIFLLSLSCRLGRDGLPATDIRLEMSRSDIANYLGLAKETVIRTLGALDRAGVVHRSTDGKALRIMHPDRLAAAIA